MTHGSLFSGIGGFDLASEWMGWKNKFHCEWNPFGQRVLHHYWPDAETFTDITKSDFTKYANTIDILTGGFPCQPYSTAGKRLGKDDERHLWPEMLRAIREIQPRWVVGENVRGLVSWNGGMVFDEVQTDLEAEGYEVLPFLLPACAVNAPHRRDRIWFVAYAGGNGYQLRGLRKDKSAQGKCESIKEERERFWNDTRGVSESGIAPNPERFRQQGQGWAKRFSSSKESATWKASWSYDDGRWPTQPPVCRGNDGISTKLLRQRIREDCMGVISEKEIDKIISKAVTEHRTESIKAYGNAIVPQVALQIFKAIEQYESFTLI